MSKRPRRAYLAELEDMPASKRARTQTLNKTVQIAVARQLRANTDLMAADVNAIFANVTDAGTVVSAFTNLIRGDNGLNNFAGNQVKPTSIRLRFSLQITGQPAIFANIVRVMVVQWWDASVPTATGILQTVGGTNSILCPPSLTNKEQMTVLADKVYDLTPKSGNGTAQGPELITRSIYVPGKKLKRTKFNSTTTAIQDGGIYMLFISAQPATQTVFPQIAYYSRVTYTD